MTPEIKQLIQRLRLSDGDVLALAREAAEDASLRSVQHLNPCGRANLETLLRFLAQPVEPELFVRFEVLRVATGVFRDYDLRNSYCS